jgi:hypothetical protein
MPASRAQQAATAERRAKLVKMRIAGHSFDECAQALGYSSRDHATKDFCRILEHNIAQQRTSLEVYRELEVLRLDDEIKRLEDLYAQVKEVLARDHVTVSVGRVVELNGEPIPDESPFLQAVDRLLRIEDARRRNAERRAKLLGLDAAQRVEVLTIDAIDAKVAELNEQLATLDREDREAAATEGAAD